MQHPLLIRAQSGDRRALARVISMIEDGRDEASGSPGAGKSTLASALIGRMRHGDVPSARRA